MSIIAVSGPVSARDAALIKAVVAGMTPALQKHLDNSLAPMKAENAELRERIAELESRSIPDDVFILQLVQDEIAKIPPAENGKDADPEQVASLVAEEVERAVAALPVPQDGKSVGVEDVAPLIADEVAKAVAEIPVPKDGSDGRDGKDGAGIIDGFVRRDGHLIATLSDGTTRDFGEIVGKDGAPGKDGRDGIDLDSFEAIVLDDDRTIELKFVSGETERVASFKWPQPLDCGVYKSGEQYQRGDVVTWGGSLWLAQRDTEAKPDTPDSGWRLAVKKGRDGKDGKNG